MRPSPGRGSSRSDTAPCGWSTSGWAARSSGCSGGSARCRWRMTMLADVPMVFILVGIAAYTVLSGADFGAGLWTLVPGGGQASAAATRDHTRHAIGPVWEANHVWLIFVLTVAWTCYPGAFGSIVSTLAVPLALAGLLVIRVSARPLWDGLTSGLGLALVIVSALAGVVTMVLVWLGRFGPARASAALAVAAVIAGWAAAQSPELLPGLTVAEAAAGRSTLIATIIGVAVGAVVLVPSLAVLYSLVLRGRLDTADDAAASSGGAAGPGEVRPRAAGHRAPRGSLAPGVAVVTLVAGIGLLVFAEPAWANGLGAVALIACAVTVFALASRAAP